MASRLFRKLSGSLAFGSMPQLTVQRFTQTSTSAKTSATNDYMREAEGLAHNYSKHVDDAIARWAKCDEVYYGKERDLTKFPQIKYPLTHPKVRLAILPDSWFQSLYSKTGVTGPYLFLFGTASFLISKELWVVDPHFVEFVLYIGGMTYLIKKVGPIAAKYFDKHVEDQENLRYYEPLKQLHENLDRTIATAKEESTRSSAVNLLTQAKEENVSLQLETVYRERLQQVHRAVVRRLDYHAERENTRRRYQQHHMVNWVVNQVIKDFTPTQEKETLSQCIAELKRLSQASKVQTAMA